MDAETVLNLRRSGKGYNEICRLTGMTKNQVGYICRRHGEGGFVGGAFPLTDQQVKDIVSMSGFDYVGGYEATKKPITVRCRQCGRTFERQFHIFRDVVNGTWKCGNNCPMCRKDRLEEEQDQRRIRKETEKSEREHAAWTNAMLRMEEEQQRISRLIERRLATRVCKNCGTEYSIASSGYNSEKFCSKKCAKRWAMRIKNDRRVKRMAKRKHDNDITLERLYSKDRGICYLCGKPCDWKDMDSEGNAHNNYPSIDHVIPLSKGGTHTWDNIKLAHRGCNTAKRDKIYAP